MLCLLAQRAPAQTPGDAARDLARKVAAVVAREPAGLSVRNQSSLAAADFEEVRRALEAELRALGVRGAETGAAAEIRVTASENYRNGLLVAEVRRGQETLVLISDWPRRPGAARPPVSGVRLEKRLVWEQDDPILDFALLENGGEPRLLVLDTTRVALYGRAAAGWEPRQSFPISLPAPWPRDPRGRLFVQGAAFQAYLPGMVCRGTLEPPAMDCQADEPLWLLSSGAALAGYAPFRPGRNEFTGALTTAAAAHAAVPPFYTMALAGAGAEPLWLFAMPDGRTAVYGPALASTGRTIPGWGDIAGVEVRCGAGRQVLAARADDAGELDTIQAWEITGDDITPLSSPVDFPGPLTALWSSGAASASAVSRDPETGRYAAYHVAIGCGS